MSPADLDEDVCPTVTVVETSYGWDVSEQGRVVSHHQDPRLAEKAALDWASRRFLEGQRLVVVLG